MCDKPSIAAVRRFGVTLLELMLALSLIAVLAAVAWPTIGRSLKNRQLNLAAEQLRADLVRARARSIHTGSVYLIRFQPQSAEYTIQPRESSMIGQTAGSFGNAAADAGGLSSEPGLPSFEVKQLPEGVQFLGADLLVDARAQEAIGQLGTTANNSRDNGQPEQVLLCYPDGATSTARLTLINEEERCIPLDLRGLTGVVTIGEVFLSEDLPQ